ncbi:hypothetical protein [Legionella spiritensis]|uniref:Protein-tyrosine phosphatase n=1 Tax=Legionella spiritensis TaxID=452 RepID=A0A0W0ZAU3_LEGSP|nr:hypothetical protein [Legionella spiritensis]KTD66267.1 protein-tyrosine phosphatase [Legionella spiritensis]SNV48402.1 protein-tyrosine phosphatase [Legionella spiritensis]
MKYLLYLCLFFISSLLYAEIRSEIHTIKLGDTPVQIVREGESGNTFVHLHENERTALKAAERFIAQQGGTLITLRHSGQRNIVFRINKVTYQFDPNRIFTDQGIKKTLRQYGPYSGAAHREVKRLAQGIIRLIPPGKVIAVHNNKGYSMTDYFPGHPLARDAKAWHHPPGTNTRNFYFVTRYQEYLRLKKLKYNVVLQADHAQNDGSLSYYLAGNNYINIESAHGQLDAQFKMLNHA